MQYSKTIFILLMIMIIGFIVYQYRLDKDYLENTHDYLNSNTQTTDKPQLIEGRFQVQMPIETQQLAGIKTVPIKESIIRSEDMAHATVIDIKELIDARSTYRSMLAKKEILNAVFRNSSTLLEELKRLYSEANNISVRQLREAKLNWEMEQARIKSMNIELENIHNNMIQKWGTKLIELALNDESDIFNRLLNQQEHLILLSLKGDQQLLSDTAFVFVNRFNDRTQARMAYFISAAPFSDKTLQGETYFFRTNADRLRIGMRLYVWLPNTGFTGKGVSIPSDAVLWYAGKPWAYVQVSEALFSRRNLIEPIQTSNIWLVKKNFKVGESIVVSGPQTLLSEEFKRAIPDEDDD